MRAVIVAAPDERPALCEIPRPVPGPGEVLLRVRAVALNPLDVTLASGALSQVMEHRYPLVLGRDVAGLVEEVGPDVAEHVPGTEVIGHVPFVAPFHRGVLAEYAILPATAVVARPAGLDHLAAALPLAGGAALAALDAAHVGSGQIVLINGASGSVGRYAIQLAVARGATVVATGAPHDSQRLRDLGAVTVVDFTNGSPVVAQVHAEYPAGVDVLVNLWGETVHDVPLGAVRSGGFVSSIRPVPDADVVARRGLRGGGITIASPGADTLSLLAERAAAGALQIDVARVVSMDAAIDALDEIAAGKAGGKIIVDLQR